MKESSLVSHQEFSRDRQLNCEDEFYKMRNRAKSELEANGITSEQRLAYIPGLSELLYRGVKPWEYQIAKKAVLFIPSLLFGRDEVSEKREDAWRLYLGLPQINNTFEIAEYRPSKSTQLIYYYKIKNFWTEEVLSRIVASGIYMHGVDNSNMSIIDKIFSATKMGAYDINHKIMGRYTVSSGQDEKGSYFSYYDRWSLHYAFEKKRLIGKPFEIYDRLYYSN